MGDREAEAIASITTELQWIRKSLEDNCKETKDAYIHCCAEIDKTNTRVRHLELILSENKFPIRIMDAILLAGIAAVIAKVFSLI
jgi:hypothetical protein